MYKTGYWMYEMKIIGKNHQGIETTVYPFHYQNQQSMNESSTLQFVIWPVNNSSIWRWRFVYGRRRIKKDNLLRILQHFLLGLLYQSPQTCTRQPT